jgi:hypothetical protein
MRQAVTNKLQTLINKERITAHKVKQEAQKKKLINNIIRK